MKKIIALMMCVSVLTACGAEGTEVISKQDSSPSEVTEESSEEVPGSDDTELVILEELTDVPDESSQPEEESSQPEEESSQPEEESGDSGEYPDYSQTFTANDSYEIENPIDGKYVFEYSHTVGCAANDVKGVLRYNGEAVCGYSSSAYVGYYPEKAAHLFDIDGEGVYYIENRAVESHPDTPPICYIAYRGEKYPDFTEKDTEKQDKQRAYAADLLKANLSEEELTYVLSSCGYGVDLIQEIYNYNN